MTPRTSTSRKTIQSRKARRRPKQLRVSQKGLPIAGHQLKEVSKKSTVACWECQKHHLLLHIFFHNSSFAHVAPPVVEKRPEKRDERRTEASLRECKCMPIWLLILSPLSIVSFFLFISESKTIQSHNAPVRWQASVVEMRTEKRDGPPNSFTVPPCLSTASCNQPENQTR